MVTVLSDGQLRGPSLSQKMQMAENTLKQAIELRLESATQTLKAMNQKLWGEKTIVIDPNKHTWRAYAASGKLIKSGLVTAGSRWCPDIGKACKTKAGVFRVYSLGSAGCKSRKFPVGIGGAPMPYCMFFNGGQAIHGSYQVVPRNVSHGCLRVRVNDAKWLRFNFVTVGTKVIVKAY